MIKITDKYYLELEPLNLTLKKKVVNQKFKWADEEKTKKIYDKNYGKEHFVDAGYFSRLSQVVKWMIEEEIKGSEVDTVIALKANIEGFIESLDVDEACEKLWRKCNRQESEIARLKKKLQ